MTSIGELVIDLDAGLKTDEQFNIIRGLADYLERETTEEEKIK